MEGLARKNGREFKDLPREEMEAFWDAGKKSEGKPRFAGKELSGNEAMSQAIIVRKCESLNDFHRCVHLQREVWGEADLEVEPATMFVVAAHTGGEVLGAFDGDRLVGYTLAVVGLRDRIPYLHSHMTGVHGEYRDRGVGRMLKLFQRTEALGRGIRLIQWTFDPLELRNAHFNLNRLGAICRKYHPNLYGVTTSRFIAAWRPIGCWSNGISTLRASWRPSKVSSKIPSTRRRSSKCPRSSIVGSAKDHKRLVSSRRASAKNSQSGLPKATRRSPYALRRGTGRISSLPGAIFRKGISAEGQCEYARLRCRKCG